MWQRVKRFFIFQSKALEFRYRTWKSRRAIRRAYREASTVARIRLFARAHARFAVLVCIGGAVVAVMFLAGPRVLSELTSAYTAARLRADAETKRAAAKGVKKPEESKPAVSVKPPVSSATRSPAEGTSAGGLGETQYCILANKAIKTVFLLSKTPQGGAWSVTERFSAVMGRNDGQKQAAGDRRTPEGIYFIVGRKDRAELNPLYGHMAYVLNYPNEEDRQAGRTGQGIWIHGMPEDSSRMVTRGCIVMQNAQLTVLEGYLKLGVGTPVVIIDKPDLSSPEEYPDYGRIEQRRRVVLKDYAQREQDFKAILSGWKSAWASRDITTYSQFYDAQRFFSSGMSWDAWRERKQNIFQSLDTIEISVDNIRLVDCSESTAVVVFRQQYAASLQSARQNAKRLCFYRSGGRWLIYREETFSTEEFLL